ncbi:MAG TPA: ABC transporter permease [Pilimelia sp.]|nr:ABC transporter permease [Pilimelia sp.]
MTALTRHRLFWPVAMLAALLLSNLLRGPGFFAIRIQDGHLYGSLIDILANAAPIMIISLGMTLVIATGGIDLSVGSLVAISGALACLHISRQPDQNAMVVVVTAIAIAIGVSVVLGLWNGVLVAGAGIQPIIATLILMVAGRGVAQLITGGQIINVTSTPYKVIGSGFIATLPFAFVLVAAIYALASVIIRRSALGMLVEAVGGNPEASRLVGIRSKTLLIGVYVVSGLCAGVAGLIVSSDVLSADGNNAGLWFELDAILAVVIGGTALTGGRFSLAGTLIGALVIQTLTTTIYSMQVTPQTILVYKAVVVLMVCLLQSPTFRAKVFRRWRGPGGGPPPAPTGAPISPAPQPADRSEVAARTATVSKEQAA